LDAVVDRFGVDHFGIDRFLKRSTGAARRPAPSQNKNAAPLGGRRNSHNYSGNASIRSIDLKPATEARALSKMQFRRSMFLRAINRDAVETISGTRSL